MTLPVADAHSHTNPVRGLGAEKIARRFREAGGWFMALVSLSPWAYGIEPDGLDSYRRVVDILARECYNAQQEGVRVACLAGFHPADVDKLIDKYRMDPVEVLELGLRVVEEAAKLCRDDFLDGIGEVGRQHFKTTPERAIISHLIMERAIELARDNDCLVHLHLENAGKITIELVERLVARLSPRDKSRIVFHHSKPGQAVEATRLGYSATIPGKPLLLDNVLGRIPPVFMIESDHIDDPKRPGAVVYPWVMASHIQRLAKKIGDDYLYKINVDNIVRVYRVEPP